MFKFVKAPNKTAHNERQKLLANFFNNLGVAAMATTFVLPLVSATPRIGITLLVGALSTTVFLAMAHHAANQIVE